MADTPMSVTDAIPKCSKLFDAYDAYKGGWELKEQVGRNEVPTWLKLFPPKSVLAVLRSGSQYRELKLGNTAQFVPGAATPVLICVTETPQEDGTYRTQSGNFGSALDIRGYRRSWTAFAIRWNDGRWINVESFLGSAPPKAVSTGDSTTGEPPVATFLHWVQSKTRLPPHRPVPEVTWLQTEWVRVGHFRDIYGWAQSHSELRPGLLIKIRLPENVVPEDLYVNGLPSAPGFSRLRRFAPTLCLGPNDSNVSQPFYDPAGELATCVEIGAEAVNARTVKLAVSMRDNEGNESISETHVVQVPAPSDTAFDRFVNALSESMLSQRGQAPTESVPASADWNVIVGRVLESTAFDGGSISRHDIIRRSPVTISGRPSQFWAYLVDTNLGRKIVLLEGLGMRREVWSRVYAEDGN